MTKGQKDYLEGYINTLRLHIKKADTECIKVLYTGVIRGLKEAIEITGKIK